MVGKEAGKVRAFKQGGLITLSREMIGNGRVPGNMIVRRKDFWVNRRIGIRAHMCFHFSRNIILVTTQSPSALPQEMGKVIA